MSCICELRDDILKIIKDVECEARFHAHKYKDADTIAEWNNIRNTMIRVKNSTCCKQKKSAVVDD